MPGLNKDGLQSRTSKVQANGQKAGEGHHRIEKNLGKIFRSLRALRMQEEKKVDLLRGVSECMSNAELGLRPS